MVKQNLLIKNWFLSNFPELSNSTQNGTQYKCKTENKLSKNCS